MNNRVLIASFKCEGGFSIPYGKPCPECGATERQSCRRAPDWRGRALASEAKLARITEIIGMHDGGRIDEQDAYNMICEEMGQ